MKTVIFHPDTTTRKAIRQRVEFLGHTVLHDDSSLYQALIGVMERRPNVAVLVELEPAMRHRTETIFAQWAILTRIVWLPPDLRGPALDTHLQKEFSNLDAA